MFNHFFDTTEFEHYFSSSFISLILKVGNSTSFNCFRPILLLGWVHKLITRVLAARLRGVNYSHSTFIRGKNIFEGWTVASEMLDV